MRAPPRDRALGAAALLAGLAGCSGIYSDPVHPGGTGGGPAIGALTGDWKPCGQLGAGGPWRVAISADGATAAVLFPQGQVAVQRLPGGEVIRTIQASEGPPVLTQHPDDFGSPAGRDVVLSADGAVVAVADGRHVAAWRVADGTALFDVPGQYRRLRLSPSGTAFLTWTDLADTLFSPELRTTSGGDLLRRCDAAAAVAFSADGRQVLSFVDQTLTASAVDGDGAALRTATLRDPMTEPAFSPDGNRLIGRVGSDVRLYRTADATELWSRTTVPGPVAFSSDGASFLVLAGFSVYVADTETGLGVLRDMGGFRGAALGPGGRPLLVADMSGLYLAADATSVLQPFPTLPGQGLPIRTLAISSDGRRLAIGSVLHIDPAFQPPTIAAHPESVLLWNLESGTLLRSWAGVTAGSVAFSADGRKLLITAADDAGGSRLEEWDVDGQAPAWTLAADESTWTAASYSHDGARVAVNFTDGVGVVTHGGTTLAPTVAREVVSPGSAFSPDGRYLVTSGPSLWRLPDLSAVWQTSAMPSPPEAPMYRDNWMVVSPDGSAVLESDAEFSDQAATSAFAVSARLYRMSDGVLLQDLGSSLNRRPAFSPDGRWIAAGDLVWEVATGRTVVLHADPLSISVSAFAPDGTIATAREDGVIDLFCPR